MSVLSWPSWRHSRATKYEYARPTRRAPVRSASGKSSRRGPVPRRHQQIWSPISDSPHPSKCRSCRRDLRTVRSTSTASGAHLPIESTGLKPDPPPIDLHVLKTLIDCAIESSVCYLLKDTSYRYIERFSDSVGVSKAHGRVFMLKNVMNGKQAGAATVFVPNS